MYRSMKIFNTSTEEQLGDALTNREKRQKKRDISGAIKVGAMFSLAPRLRQRSPLQGPAAFYMDMGAKFKQIFLLIQYHFNIFDIYSSVLSSLSFGL